MFLCLYIDEVGYIPEVSDDGKPIVSLDCNTKCSEEKDAVVVWNTHLLSENYDIIISCQNGNCTNKNEDTGLLKLEQELTMANTTLGFRYYPIYQDALVGCVVTADSCTENRYWIINGAGMITINCLYCMFTCFIFSQKGLLVAVE